MHNNAAGEWINFKKNKPTERGLYLFAYENGVTALFYCAYTPRPTDFVDCNGVVAFAKVNTYVKN